MNTPYRGKKCTEVKIKKHGSKGNWRTRSSISREKGKQKEKRNAKKDKSTKD